MKPSALILVALAATLPACAIADAQHARAAREACASAAVLYNVETQADLSQRYLNLLMNRLELLTSLAKLPSTPLVEKGRALAEFRALHDSVETLMGQQAYAGLVRVAYARQMAAAYAQEDSAANHASDSAAAASFRTLAGTHRQIAAQTVADFSPQAAGEPEQYRERLRAALADPRRRCGARD